MRQNQQVSFPVPGAVYKGCSKDQRLTSARCKLTAPGPRGPRTPSRSACPRHREQGCCKVRPVEGRSCSAALKSEDRRPKSEFREWPDSIGCCSAGVAINSDFGLRSSGLGFGMARPDFRAVLHREPGRSCGVAEGRLWCEVDSGKETVMEATLDRSCHLSLCRLAFAEF